MKSILSSIPVVLISLFVLALAANVTVAMDWPQIQTTKRTCLQLAAQHAMEQQKTTQAEPVALEYFSTAEASGKMTITRKGRDAVSLAVEAAPRTGRPAGDFIRITLPKPVDMIAAHSGLAVIAKTQAGSSPEVRIGVRLIGPNGTVVCKPTAPIVSPWGDATHELYFDWAFLNYADAQQAVDALRSIETIEITAAGAQRAPKRGASRGSRRAAFTLSNLRLVDYLQGSFDPSRNRWMAEQRKPDLTLQHRCQEVTGLVARFGGDAGRQAAADALDMAARTQCWDGSFLCTRRGPHTVATGEYTFGFTLYGLLCGYQTLDQAKSPLLDEKLTIGGKQMTRRQACLRMFYRGAMARTAALPSQYRDDTIGGDTLMTGANRVLGYAIAMRMIADTLEDKAQAKRVLAHYKPTMQQIADAQGKYSGGFPVLGEGNKYDGKGIHYDCGYIRTHMDWLVVGVLRTGDPLLVQMLRKYQTVFDAAMNYRGLGIKSMISERHPHRKPGEPHGPEPGVMLILPHATYQVGLKHNMPIIAQWGYNVGQVRWGDKPANHFTFASHGRGYSLAAHTSILYDDLASEPIPADPGYVFPRQYPIWSARLYTKHGTLVRTSRTFIQPDGTSSTDFDIKVGEYPVTVGVPVKVRSSEGLVAATAVSLTGWPRLLPADAEIVIGGDVEATGRLGQPVSFKLEGPTQIKITGPQVQLPSIAGGETVPFAAELILEPETPGQAVEMTVLNGTGD